MLPATNLTSPLNLQLFESNLLAFDAAKLPNRDRHTGMIEQVDEEDRSKVDAQEDGTAGCLDDVDLSAEEQANELSLLVK